MERPLAYLKKRADDNWLIGYDSRQFTQLAEQLYLELTQQLLHKAPKILLAERNPVRFLAGFIAACAAGCPVFLQSQLGKTGMATSLGASSTRLDFGVWRWGLAVRDYYPNPQPLILTKWIMIPTGGSSGQIRLPSWETLMASVRGFQQYFQLNQVNSLCVPLYHVSGLMQFCAPLPLVAVWLFCHSNNCQMVKCVI